MIYRRLSRIIAISAGAVLLVAGVLKALDPASFAADVRNYRLLPWTGVVLLALYLPWLEIVCGAALILRIGYRGALCIATALFAMFLAAYGSTLWRGLDIDCGCFGHGLHRGAAWVLVPDAIFLTALLWLLRVELSSGPEFREGQSR